MTNNKGVREQEITQQEIKEQQQQQQQQDQDQDQESFTINTFTPTSFDQFTSSFNLNIDRVHLAINNLQQQQNQNQNQISLLSNWSSLICSSLILNERELTLISSDRQKRLILPIQTISLHGITSSSDQDDRGPPEEEGRTTTTMTKRSIYCQLDYHQLLHPQSESESHPPTADEEELELLDPIEVVLTPEDPLLVQKIYDGLSFCASIQPRPLAESNTKLNNGNNQSEDFDLEDQLVAALLNNNDDDDLSPLANTATEDSSVPQVYPANRFQPY